MRPNPVTSVQPLIEKSLRAKAASLLRVAIDSIKAFSVAGSKRSAFIAVLSMPVPRAFVKMRTSPSFTVLFFSILSGWTNPLTQRPYFGSWSLIV